MQIDVAPIRARLLTAIDIMYDRLGGQYDAQYELDGELLFNRFWGEAESFKRTDDQKKKLVHFWAMFSYANEIIAREYGVELVYPKAGETPKEEEPPPTEEE